MVILKRILKEYDGETSFWIRTLKISEDLNILMKYLVLHNAGNFLFNWESVNFAIMAVLHAVR